MRPIRAASCLSSSSSSLLSSWRWFSYAAGESKSVECKPVILTRAESCCCCLRENDDSRGKCAFSSCLFRRRLYSRCISGTTDGCKAVTKSCRISSSVHLRRTVAVIVLDDLLLLLLLLLRHQCVSTKQKRVNSTASAVSFTAVTEISYSCSSISTVSPERATAKHVTAGDVNCTQTVCAFG